MDSWKYQSRLELWFGAYKLWIQTINHDLTLWNPCRQLLHGSKHPRHFKQLSTFYHLHCGQLDKRLKTISMIIFRHFYHGPWWMECICNLCGPPLGFTNPQRSRNPKKKRKETLLFPVVDLFPFWAQVLSDSAETHLQIKAYMGQIAPIGQYSSFHAWK